MVMISRRIVIASVTAVAFGYVLYRIYKCRRRKRQAVERQIVRAWNGIIGEPTAKFDRVLVGINCCVDLIVSASQLMAVMHMLPSTPTDHKEIRTIDEFRETLTYFFSHSAPGERYTTDEHVFSTLALMAEKKVKPMKLAVGGNAALFGNKIAMINTKAHVLLVGPIGPQLKPLLLPTIQTQNSVSASKDEVHLIMQYGPGDKWGDHVVQSSTRFITSHDMFSSSLDAIKLFFLSVSNFKPNLVVFSGLHLMDSQPAEVRDEKLAAIYIGLREMKAVIPIHFELASVADLDYGKQLLQQVVPHVHSLGLNEQELAFISRAGDGPFSLEFATKSTSIEPHMATEIIAWLLTRFGRDNKSDSGNKDYRLQRVHLHTVRYHMLVTIGKCWSNGPSAIAAAARLAGKQAGDGIGVSPENLDPSSVEMRIGLDAVLDQKNNDLRYNPQQGVMSWSRNDMRYNYTPVLMSKKPLKVVGLGDAISATGLTYSQFDHTPDFK